MATQRFEKNATLDHCEGPIVVRDVTQADAADLAPSDPRAPGTDDTLAAQFLRLADGQGCGLFAVNGARHVRLRIFAANSAATGTVRLALHEYMHASPRPLSATDTSTVVKHKGSTIFDLTFTCAGSTTVNVNPGTGVAVGSTTFYEASTLTTTTAVQENRVRLSSTGGATSELSIVVDVFGAKRLYPQIVALGGGATPSRVIVTCQRLD